MRNILKRTFSLLLALTLCLSVAPILPVVTGAEENSETMTIAANKGTLSGTTITWELGNITFTVSKGSSSTAIRTSDSDHFRMYIGNTATITCAAGNITKIEMQCTSTSYMASNLGTNSSTTITITPTTSSDTYTTAAANKQTRIKSITVYYEVPSGGDTECTHANTTTTTVNATCTEAGSTTVTCNDCGEIVSSTTTEALGHAYGAWTVITDPTCSTPGEQTRTCSRCDATETEAIATIDHTDANSDTVCDICGKSLQAWTLVTDASVLTVNAQVIIVAVDSDVALSTTQNGNNRGQVAVTKGEGVIEDISADVQVLTLKEGKVDGTFAFYTGSGYLHAASSSSNYLRTETTLSDNSSWLISVTDDVTSVVAQGTYTRNVMQYNASSGIFACYGSATQKAISLYYIPAPSCAHPNLETIEAKDPTCTEAGNTAGTYCPDCETYSDDYEELEALGHDWDDGTVVAPTYNENGYTLYTCSRCEETKQDEETDALKYVNIVYFAVPEGVEPVASMTSGKEGITLPTANCPEGYEFVGWTENAVDSAETMPEKYVAGQTFKPKAETTLYALYSITEGGGEGGYELKDISEISATDSVVITMTASDGTIYALTNGGGTSSAPAGTIVTAANGKLTSEVVQNLKWNVVAVDGGYEIYPQGTTATWLYCFNDNNGVRVGTNANKIFTISGDHLYNNAMERYVGVYTTKPDWRCYTSINSNITGQVLGFYVEAASGTTTYTTGDATAPKAAFVVDGKEYVTFEAALRAHAEEGTYIKLLGNMTGDVTLTRDTYLDLAGNDWDGTITTGAYTLYGMDSSTDDYDCTDGNGNNNYSTVKVDGNVALQYKTSVTGKVRRYLTYTDENGAVSFHRIYVGITSMNLRPGVKGVGYKAAFRADAVAQSMLNTADAYGFKLWVEGFEGTPVSASKDLKSFMNSGYVTLRLQNFDMENFGDKNVYATVYLKLADGTVIESATYQYTLNQMLVEINKGFSGYTEAQQNAIKAWCQQYADYLAGALGEGNYENLIAE